MAVFPILHRCFPRLYVTSDTTFAPPPPDDSSVSIEWVGGKRRAAVAVKAVRDPFLTAYVSWWSNHNGWWSAVHQPAGHPYSPPPVMAIMPLSARRVVCVCEWAYGKRLGIQHISELPASPECGAWWCCGCCSVGECYSLFCCYNYYPKRSIVVPKLLDNLSDDAVMKFSTFSLNLTKVYVT